MKNRKHILSMDGMLDSSQKADEDASKLIALLRDAEQKRFSGKIIIDFAQADRMSNEYANQFVSAVFQKYSLSFVLQHVELKNRNCFIINSMNEATQLFFQKKGSHSSCERCHE